jgi:hypothetical protein
MSQRYKIMQIIGVVEWQLGQAGGEEKKWRIAPEVIVIILKELGLIRRTSDPSSRTPSASMTASSPAARGIGSAVPQLGIHRRQKSVDEILHVTSQGSVGSTSVSHV